MSLFTAVLATQAIILSLRGSRILQSRARSAPATRKHKITFDFMGASKWFFSMSGLILLIGALAIAGKGLNFGIDFESRHADHRVAGAGRRASRRSATRSAPQGFGDAKIQTVNNPDLGKHVVQVSTDDARRRRTSGRSTRR